MALSTGFDYTQTKAWIQFRLNKLAENGGLGGSSKQLVSRGNKSKIHRKEIQVK